MRPGCYREEKACSNTENRRDFREREEWQESVFGVWKGCWMQLGLACSTEGFVICNYVVLRRPVVLCPATERLFVGQHNVSRLWKEREWGICLQPSKIHPHNERESEWKVIQWRASSPRFYDHFNPVVWLFSLNILILFHALQFQWILPHNIYDIVYKGFPKYSASWLSCTFEQSVSGLFPHHWANH